MADTRELVFQAFRSLGMSPQAALGAMYSLGGESGATFNTKSYNPNDPGGSVGIGQWNRTRRAAEEALAKSMGVAPTDPYAQVAYLKQELQGPYSNVLRQLQATSDPAEANRIWTKQYEAPKVDNSAQRFAGGHNVGTLDAQGNFVPGVPGVTINSPLQAADRAGPAGTGPAPAPAPAAPAEPPSAFEAVMQAYAKPQQQAVVPTLPTPNLNDNSTAAAAPILQQLIARKRAEMGFLPLEMGTG